MGKGDVKSKERKLLWEVFSLQMLGCQRGGIATRAAEIPHCHQCQHCVHSLGTDQHFILPLTSSPSSTSHGQNIMGA